MTGNVVDLPTWLKTVHRERRRTDAARTVILRRRYATTPADLWDALTTPARVNRWFARIEGTAAAGQTIVLHDNGVPISWTADIRTCEAPQRLVMSWRSNNTADMPGYDHDESGDVVQVTLTPDGDGTMLELQHSSPDQKPWDQGAGLGWEGIILGLSGYLEDYDVAPVFESGAIWPELQGAWGAVQDHA